ncbi:MAG: hypothetical protein U1E17_04730 [Geminicoccaceae bacterium]
MLALALSTCTLGRAADLPLMRVDPLDRPLALQSQPQRALPAAGPARSRRRADRIEMAPVVEVIDLDGAGLGDVGATCVPSTSMATAVTSSSISNGFRFMQVWPRKAPGGSALTAGPG